VAAAFLLIASGCSSTKIYTVKTLPAAWHATPTANIQTLDLTKLASATIPEDRIAKGDVLEVTIAAGSGRDSVATFPTRVKDDGAVEVLNVGDVPVLGMSLPEADFAIAQACIQRDIYRSPHVVVTMKAPKVNRVTVMGAVQKPSTVLLRSGNSDILQAIIEAGGPTENAGTVVEVRHPGYRGSVDEPHPIAEGDESNPNRWASHETESAGEPTSYRINLASLGKEDASTYELEDGAVVSLEKQDPPALQVLGLVRKPDRYEFPIGKNLRLLDAISLAGGTSNQLANKVFVIRRREKQEPMLVEVSMRAAKRHGEQNMLLEPGDTVSVEQTPGTVIIDAVRTIGVNLGGALF
jgi:polysaccharide export outer membrane protein